MDKHKVCRSKTKKVKPKKKMGIDNLNQGVENQSLFQEIEIEEVCGAVGLFVEDFFEDLGDREPTNEEIERIERITYDKVKKLFD